MRSANGKAAAFWRGSCACKRKQFLIKFVKEQSLSERVKAGARLISETVECGAALCRSAFPKRKNKFPRLAQRAAPRGQLSPSENQKNALSRFGWVSTLDLRSQLAESEQESGFSGLDRSSVSEHPSNLKLQT